VFKVIGIKRGLTEIRHLRKKLEGLADPMSIVIH
jgi:hypothetical protein